MGVFTHEMEVASPLPPAKAFKAFVLDFDTIFPRLRHMQSRALSYLKEMVELEVSGRLILLKPSQYLKEKVDGLDKVNFSYSYTVIEGNVLTNKYEKICYEMKFEAAPGGGTIGKRTSKYYSIGASAINEEEIKAGIEAQAGVFKAVEDYLLANPNY
ncbi:hypothetical protein REPUB_Repub20aG0132200 [Reevesia pubescens]